MVLQIADRLREEIREYGCYFMSLLYLINHMTNMTLTTGRINALRRLFISQGWMDENCFILDPVAILGWAGINANIVTENGTHKLPPSYQIGPGEYEILEFKRPGEMSHFVVGPYDGRRVGYDPYGDSESVRYGKLISKRVFRVWNVASKREAA